jgi:hypothetical protein
MNMSYNEIRKHCKLLDYKQEFTGKTALWVETWQDAGATHRALFGETYTDLPLTIITNYDNPSNTEDLCESYC